jgi:hypothetical protein
MAAVGRTANPSFISNAKQMTWCATQEIVDHEIQVAEISELGADIRDRPHLGEQAIEGSEEACLSLGKH